MEDSFPLRPVPMPGLDDDVSCASSSAVVLLRNMVINDRSGPPICHRQNWRNCDHRYKYRTRYFAQESPKIPGDGATCSVVRLALTLMGAK